MKTRLRKLWLFFTECRMAPGCPIVSCLFDGEFPTVEMRKGLQDGLYWCFYLAKWRVIRWGLLNELAFL